MEKTKLSNPRKPTVFHSNEGVWVNWFRHALRYLAITEQTQGKYCLSIGKVDMGQGASPHSHNFDEGFYVLSGSVEFTAGRESVVLNAGDFINIKAGTVHFPRGASPQTSEMLVIAAPSGFDQFQLAVGGQLQGPNAVTKSDEQMHTAVASLARDYGIDMFPSLASSQAAPNIHVRRKHEGDLIDVVGDRYRFLATSEHTGGTYAIWHATISPGGGPPPHLHRREEEGFFVLHGELRFEADGQQFIGRPGTFVNLPNGSRHRFSNPTESAAEVLILVAPGGLEEMFRHTGSIVQDASLPIQPPTPDEIQRLISVANDYGIELG